MQYDRTYVQKTSYLAIAVPFFHIDNGLSVCYNLIESFTYEVNQMFRTKIVSSLENCFWDSKIDDFNAIDRLSALKNERISFQLLCSFDESSTVRRILFDLKIDGEMARYVKVREVMGVPAAMPVMPNVPADNYLRTEPGLYPDLLIPLRYDSRVSVVYHNLCAIWVEIDLSEVNDVKAGEYSLNFSLVDGEHVASTAKITLDIIDAELPPQSLIFTQWFHCDCLASYYNCDVWSERHWEIVENFAQMARKNGVNLLLTPVFTPSLDTYVGGERLTVQLVGVTKNNNEYSFDFSKLDRWIDMCDRIGIEYFEISHFFTQWGANHAPKIMATVDGEYKKIFGWETDATSDEYTCFLRTFITAFLDHMKSRGDDKRCFFHVSDEPTEVQLESYKSAKAIVSDLLEGYPIMDAISSYEFYSKGILEIPIPCNDHIKPFIENKVPGLWTYYCSAQWRDVSNRFLSMPSYRNRSIGMQMYKYDIVGFLHWGYNFYNTMRSYDAINPYTDTCGDGWWPAGDTFSVYPASDGTALESLRIIVFYEALQDMRAMTLAESIYGKDAVVEAIETAFGSEIAFDKCARSSEQMLAVRNAVNELIRKGISK